MNITEDYCRLCADLKQCNELTNMEMNEAKRRDLTNKLTRFNIEVCFDNILPKAVCFGCLKSLDLAYDFVTTVDTAQRAFTDYISSPDIKKEENKDEELSDEDSDEFEAPYSNIEDDIEIKDEPLNVETREEIEIKYIPETIQIEIAKESAGINPNKKKVEKSKAKTVIESKSNVKLNKKLKTEDDIELTESWKEYDWLCAYCDRFFQTPSELRVHSMQYHSTCNPYRCFDCRARGIHLDKVVTHICRHRPLLILTCYICSEKCRSLKEMKKHKASHLLTGYVCVGCNMTFSSQDELDEHDIKYYKNAEANSLLAVPENDSLTCVICQKASKTRILLNRHLLIHTDRKREHVCDVCGKSFYHKKELVQHYVVHSDARPFKCEVCKYSFKLKSELKKHVTIHFGPKPFACEQCGRCFRLKKELANHSAVHNESRPHACTQCNKSFRFRHLLQQHLLLHTNSKPYTCDICAQKFRNWSNYNKHSKDIHGVDNAKRRRTAEGLYAIDPVTKEVVYPEMDKVLEWKRKILEQGRRGRPRKAANSGKVTRKADCDIDSTEGDS